MSLYKDLLSQTKDAISALERPFKVKKEQKSLEMKMLKLEEKIAINELSLQEEKSKQPLDWDKIISCIDNLELNQRQLKQLQSLETELFIEK